MLQQITGPVFEYLAENRLLIQLARKVGLPLGGTLFVGGQGAEETLDTVKQFNQDGRAATVDCLGEFIETEQDAVDITNECIKVIGQIKEHDLDAQVSLKLTSIGLRIDPDIAYQQLSRIAEAADQQNMRVTVNMEEAMMVESIVRVFERVHERYPNVGIALQANVYRSRFDLERLQATVRIVKGAYDGDDELYIQPKKTVDETYLQLVKVNLLNGNYTQIATHDEQIIQQIIDFTQMKQIDPSRFEFQMLQGMRPKRQQELVRQGYRVVIYVPHGVDWYTYLMRRLAERPANIAFTVGAMLRR